MVALLLAGLAICIVLWIVLRERVAFVSAWLPNIGADFAGVLVVVLVVERILVAIRERERAPVRRIAAQGIVAATFPLTHVLLQRRTHRRMMAGQDFGDRVALDQLFGEWRDELNALFYAVWLDATPRTFLSGLRRIAREWSRVLDRFASAFEDSDEIEFIGRIHEFVAWMSLNNDLFVYKSSIWEGIAQTAVNLRDERAQEDGSYRIEEYDFGFAGDVRESLTELFVLAAEKLVKVFQDYESIFERKAELPSDLWEEAGALSPGHYRMLAADRRARRIEPWEDDPGEPWWRRWTLRRGRARG